MKFDSIYQKVQQDIQMTPIEAETLYSYAKKLPDDSIILEIGTWKGGSAQIIGMARRRKKGKIFTVDNFRTDIFPGGRESVGDVIERLRISKIKNLTLVVGESDIFAQNWKEGMIDLLFIDGDHRYEGIKADISNWVPHVKRDGIVLFHDYDSHTEVTKAIHEAIESKLVEPIKKVGSVLVTIKS